MPCALAFAAPKTGSTGRSGPMLSWEESVEAHSLWRQGWKISAIARHLGRDRKTIRRYLLDPEARPGAQAGGKVDRSLAGLHRGPARGGPGPSASGT